MKLIYFVLCLVGYVYAEANYSSNDATPEVESSINKPARIGGWYPVFFDRYNESQIQSIVNNIKVGRVAKVLITYDENQALAKKLFTKIQSQVSLTIGLNQVKLQDGSAQFNHKRVVVTVYNLVD